MKTKYCTWLDSTDVKVLIILFDQLVWELDMCSQYVQFFKLTERPFLPSKGFVIKLLQSIDASHNIW